MVTPGHGPRVLPEEPLEVLQRGNNLLSVRRARSCIVKPDLEALLLEIEGVPPVFQAPASIAFPSRLPRVIRWPDAFSWFGIAATVCEQSGRRQLGETGAQGLAVARLVEYVLNAKSLPARLQLTFGGRESYRMPARYRT